MYWNKHSITYKYHEIILSAIFYMDYLSAINFEIRYKKNIKTEEDDNTKLSQIKMSTTQ